MSLNLQAACLSRGDGSVAARGWLAFALVVACLGCGSTRTSNTMRTATEQLLISDAIDRSVQQINFTPLAGRTVFLEEKHLAEVVDRAYLIGTMRQHMLASGCILKDARDEAEFVVEPRSGALGTDNHDLLFGIPATTVPQVGVTTTLPSAIPEIPIAKRRNQRGVAKLAVFAYRRETGEPVWQSGIVSNESTANDIWLFGAGPFNRGTIYDGTRLAGRKLEHDKNADGRLDSNPRIASLESAAVFNAPPQPGARQDDAVKTASAEAPIDASPREVDAADDAPTSERLPSAGPPVLAPPSALP